VAKNKVVLAYSGGLDTSVAVRWIAEKYDAEVVTLTIDLGGGSIRSDVEERALRAGASKVVIVDGREAFVRDFVFPALKAGAIYEGVYPLATALGRPLIAQYLVQVAEEEGAGIVAHGCTGKGNDQVRFDVSVAALNPSLKVIAPAREWGMTREQEIEYAAQHGIPLEIKEGPSYSVDVNLWGRSVEAGNLEDPTVQPPEEAYTWTRSIEASPDAPTDIEITFEAGVPVAIDGEVMEPISLIEHLGQLAGENGVGRIDHVENRLVGIKSREVYEAPAGTVLHKARQALETLTLSKEQVRLKSHLAIDYADLVYNGLWFTAHRQDLEAYVESTQRYVSGTVKVRLHKGSCTVIGRESPLSLYRHDLATYEEGDTFDHAASVGFISIYGLPVRTQSRIQLHRK
jgi:argininosuccinate synthase